MELKWRWDRTGSELELYSLQHSGRLGYIEAFEKEYHSKTDHTKRLVYEVNVSVFLHEGHMHCEEVDYVSLRKAMRALKETVTVLLIGEAYGV